MIPALALLAALLVPGVARAEPEEPAASSEAPAPEGAQAPADPLPDAREIAERAEERLRARGSRIDATLTIRSRERPRKRVVTLRLFDDRTNDRALLRVLAPEEQAGSAWLKLPPNLWRFSPETRETSRIPGAGWGEPFLGGDFTLGDLVRSSDGVRDYDHRLLEVDLHAGEARDRRAFVVEYLPRPDAGVAWGRIVAWIDAERAIPLRLDYYAPDGALVRTLQLEDLREVAGRPFPHRWVMRQAGAKKAETRLQVDAIRFDPRFGKDLFTTRRLPSGE